LSKFILIHKESNYTACPLVVEDGFELVGTLVGFVELLLLVEFIDPDEFVVVFVLLVSGLVNGTGTSIGAVFGVNSMYLAVIFTRVKFPSEADM